MARSGEYADLKAIREQLKRDGFAFREIQGKSLIRQLRQLCEAARAQAEDERPRRSA